MSAEPIKIGLACAGGVVEGAIYEVGVLCALEDAIADLRLDRLDVYVGVSAGSMVAAFLANGVTPRELADGVVGTSPEAALNFRYETLFRPAWGEFASRLTRLPRASLRALGRYLRNPLDVASLEWVGEFGRLLPVGLFDGAPLERYLARALSLGGRTNRFDELRAPLRIVTTQVDSAEVVVFGDEATQHVPISKAIQASTALPGLYCPVEIDGRHYMDGVARRTVHASQALDEGVDLLLCVNPIVPVDTTRKAAQDALGGASRLVESGLPTVLSQTFRTLVYSRARTGFRRYEHVYPDADVLLIEPTPEDYARIFSNVFSYGNRHAVCEHAYAATLQTLREREDELTPLLARHGLSLRPGVLHDRDRTLFGPRPDQLSESATDEAVLQRLDAVLTRLETHIDEAEALAA